MSSLAAAWTTVVNFITDRGLSPHGICLTWDPLLLWGQAACDAIIALSYYSIPWTLATLVRRRRDLQFGWIFLMFVAFIAACGTTHVLDVVTLWRPLYGLELIVKAVTAAASAVTAAVLIWALPQIMTIPSPERVRRELEERRATENQLHQAQKMEAIGQLAGGVAHDFNNLLTAAQILVERAQRECSTASLTDALDVLQRAGVTANRLLTFSRQRREESGGVVRVDHALRGMEVLLRSALGETIALQVRLRAPDATVAGSENELQSVVLNLVVNARDALQQWPLPAVQVTTDVHDGVLLLRVRDNGRGMDAETLRRATEPFFTTKPVGRGTGLGLSQAYGFAVSAGGRLTIRSRPDLGTGVTIELPLIEENPA